MADLALDPVTRDLVIEDGDLVIVAGPAAIAQDWNLRVALFRGEWPLDRRIGIDYQGLIFGPKPPDALLRHIYTRVTQETAGVKSIERLEFTFDRRTRQLTVDAAVIAETGESVPLVFKDILFIEAGEEQV
jgi:hypothetical protein